jgi:hypothetical protein
VITMLAAIAEIIDPVPFSALRGDSDSQAWEERRHVARVRATHIIELLEKPRREDVDALLTSLRSYMTELGHSDPGDPIEEARAVFCSALSDMFAKMRE